MDSEDPLHHFLKSTGWSAEDLLEKLQKYKSNTSTTNTKECETNTSTNTTNTNQIETGECVVDSTGDSNETDNVAITNKDESSEKLHQNIEQTVSTTQSDDIQTSDVSTNIDRNKQFMEGLASINSQTVVDGGESKLNISSSSLTDFSDTDEEEVEIKETNSSIINEIIEDIATDDNTEGQILIQSSAPEKPEVSEVTLVTVIEVNSDDDDEEDDNFEDECFSANKTIENVELCQKANKRFCVSGNSKSLYSRVVDCDKFKINKQLGFPIHEKDIVVLSSSSSESSLSAESVRQETLENKLDHQIFEELEQTDLTNPVDNQPLTQIKQALNKNDEHKESSMEFEKIQTNEHDKKATKVVLSTKVPKDDIIAQLTDAVQELDKNELLQSDQVISKKTSIEQTEILNCNEDEINNDKLKTSMETKNINVKNTEEVGEISPIMLIVMKDSFIEETSKESNEFKNAETKSCHNFDDSTIRDNKEPKIIDEIKMDSEEHSDDHVQTKKSADKEAKEIISQNQEETIDHSLTDIRKPTDKQFTMNKEDHRDIDVNKAEKTTVEVVSLSKNKVDKEIGDEHFIDLTKCSQEEEEVSETIDSFKISEFKSIEGNLKQTVDHSMNLEEKVGIDTDKIIMSNNDGSKHQENTSETIKEGGKIPFYDYFKKIDSILYKQKNKIIQKQNNRTEIIDLEAELKSEKSKDQSHENIMEVDCKQITDQNTVDSTLNNERDENHKSDGSVVNITSENGNFDKLETFDNISNMSYDENRKIGIVLPKDKNNKDKDINEQDDQNVKTTLDEINKGGIPQLPNSENTAHQELHRKCDVNEEIPDSHKTKSTVNDCKSSQKEQDIECIKNILTTQSISLQNDEKDSSLNLEIKSENTFTNEFKLDGITKEQTESLETIDLTEDNLQSSSFHGSEYSGIHDDSNTSLNDTLKQKIETQRIDSKNQSTLDDYFVKIRSILNKQKILMQEKHDDDKENVVDIEKNTVLESEHEIPKEDIYFDDKSGCDINSITNKNKENPFDCKEQNTDENKAEHFPKVIVETGLKINESNLNETVSSENTDQFEMSKVISEIRNEESMEISESNNNSRDENMDQQNIVANSTNELNMSDIPQLPISENTDFQKAVNENSGHVLILEGNTDKLSENKDNEMNKSKNNHQAGLSDDDDGDENIQKEQNVENIRNFLKKQLDSLRTKKKGSLLSNLTSKLKERQFPSITTAEEETIDIKNTEKSNTVDKNETPGITNSNSDEADNSETKYPDTVTDVTEQNDQITSLELSSLDDDILYSQTNEWGIVIANVQGGIDLIDDENSNKTNELCYTENKSYISETESPNTSMCLDNVGSNSERVEEGNESKVFAELRKIIRKPKTNKVDEPSSSKDISNFEIFHKNSSPKFTNSTIPECNQSFVSSAENSQSSGNIDESNQIAEKNSPFVSNTLDEFLTENAKLNISYKVPKLGAEDGLKATQVDESPLILKRVKELKPDPEQIVKKTSKMKPKTLAQKRKLLERQRKREQKKLEKEIRAAKIKEEKDARNYVLYKDKKIFVCTEPNIKATCIARIDSAPVKMPPKVSLMANKKKISLLEADKIQNNVKYFPGPLSKKSSLQVNGSAFWETKMKKLPRVFLNVTPAVGKLFPPEILHRLPKHDGNISANLIEFALSVLHDRNSEQNPQLKTFRFPVKFQYNQEYILTRRQISEVPHFNVISDSSDTKLKCQKDTVEAVIDDLIRYVEIKELAPSLIKDDLREITNNEINDDTLPMNENVSTVIKKNKRKSKVDNELSRLNCKVVSVEIKEEEDEKNCNKSFCRLGCVCKSLKCEHHLSYHCQKPTCMFHCSCPKERPIIYDHTVTLPAGTDVLSVDAVSRIEDEAKKNLAKVEREFTQTVIYTNDKTIVVGLGANRKSRRTTKTPVKYTEFFEDTEKDKIKHVNKSEFYRKCQVELLKLDLGRITPYCLAHCHYNCYCEGKALYSPSKSSFDVNVNKKPYISRSFHYTDLNLKRPASFTPHTKSKIQKTAFEVVNSPKINKSLEEGKKIVDNLLDEKLSISPHKAAVGSPEISHASSRPIRAIKKPSKLDDNDFTLYRPRKKIPESFELDITPESCARTTEIPSHLLKKRLMKHEVLANDFINHISESDILKARLYSNCPPTQMLEVDVFKSYLVNSSGLLGENSGLLGENSSKRKRKQIIEVRSENSTSTTPNTTTSYPSLDRALQRRKKPKNTMGSSAKIRPIFEGEIILDQSNMDLLKKMGRKTVEDGYARLLPWKYLIKGFSEGKLNIWCMTDQPSRLLMNLAFPGLNPPSSYVDIRETKQTTQVILWICRKKLPSSYDEENVSFILKENKGHFEICGVCTKNFGGEKPMHDLIPSRLIANNSNEHNFVHKDMNGISQLLVLTKSRFKLQELIEDTLENVDDTSVDKNLLYMWAALPETYRVYKWRMVFLNSDFTYLYFTNFKYTIKYTDLLSASSLAKSSDCTVWLRNADMQDNYEHKAFGIYFDPHYQDRLFIGPYTRNSDSDNDIGTLRYINQTLVCTEAFNKMRGQEGYKCGYWLVERPYTRKLNTSNCTIDLTKDEDNEHDAIKVEMSTSALRDLPAYKQNIIVHNGEKIKVIDSVPKKPEDFNRYIITNIPHFGYLGAFQYDNVQEIDVQWPFENKLLRFANERSAADFLQSRFNALLVPVPSTFKINVLVLTQIDLKNCHPIDASVLNGHYICGDFGFYNLKTLTQESCLEKIKLTKDEVIRIFLTRAKEVVNERTDHLSTMLNIGTYTKGDCDFVTVLDTATHEIEKLKEQAKKNIVVRNKLLVQKRYKAKKVFRLISNLPPEQRNQESLKFWSTMNKVEPIEIRDSDDEEATKKGKPSPFKHPDVITENRTKMYTKLHKYFSTFETNNLKYLKCLLCAAQNVDFTICISTNKFRVKEHLQKHWKMFQQETKLSIDDYILQKMTEEDYFETEDIVMSDDKTNMASTSAISLPATSSSSSSTITSTVITNNQRNMKSVLKPLIRIPTEEGNSVLVRGEPDDINVKPAPQFIQGVMVKNLERGKYVLVPSPSSIPSKLKSGMKIVISNSMIQSVNNKPMTLGSPDNTNSKINEVPSDKTAEDSDCELIENSPIKLAETEKLPFVEEVDSESDTQFEEGS